MTQNFCGEFSLHQMGQSGWVMSSLQYGLYLHYIKIYLPWFANWWKGRRGLSERAQDVKCIFQLTIFRQQSCALDLWFEETPSAGLKAWQSLTIFCLLHTERVISSPVYREVVFMTVVSSNGSRCHNKVPHALTTISGRNWLSNDYKSLWAKEWPDRDSNFFLWSIHII